MAICAVRGGCPSDYVAVSIAMFSVVLLLVKAAVPYLIHKIPRPKGSGFWLVAIQVFASFNLLLSIVMALGFLRYRRRHWWSSCYLWAVWVEGPLGFGLLLSCRIVQAFQLYNIFVKRRLPTIRSFIFLPLVLLPWIVGATILHMNKPLNHRCHMGTQWIIPVISLHALYIAALVGFTGAVQHVEFRFHELKDLWRGILVATCCIGESVHFYEEVQQLDKIPVGDHVRRIYMARHIIDMYITPGATMEVNISHCCRQEILTTPDLAHPDLFKNALNELIQLMEMNLMNDYWSSTFFMKLIEEARMKAVDHEVEQGSWNFSHRLSSVHCTDDPFHQEHSPSKLSSSSHEIELQ